MRVAPPRGERLAAVLAAVVGDAGVVNGAREQVTADCGHKAAGFCCLFCHVRLANAYQLELHVASGDHLIARWCETHGAEELTSA